ncbi:MAG: polynucleotide adenylyltransferase, partial [Candidatus Cloacimonetes bacterium]|nr:polynucleotide adenylyltransferase [Candidatus Cloacimonadota bacterium]
ILDPSNLGRQDIQNKLIRTLRAPEIVFNEDYLRILRAIRFALCTEFSLESNTAHALKISAHKIRNLSTNQIRRELVKIRDRGKLDQAKQILEDLELSDILACIQ